MPARCACAHVRVPVVDAQTIAPARVASAFVGDNGAVRAEEAGLALAAVLSRRWHRADAAVPARRHVAQIHSHRAGGAAIARRAGAGKHAVERQAGTTVQAGVDQLARARAVILSDHHRAGVTRGARLSPVGGGEVRAAHALLTERRSLLTLRVEPVAVVTSRMGGARQVAVREVLPARGSGPWAVR